MTTACSTVCWWGVNTAESARIQNWSSSHTTIVARKMSARERAASSPMATSLAAGSLGASERLITAISRLAQAMARQPRATIPVAAGSARSDAAAMR